MSWLLTSTETSELQGEFFAIDRDQQGTISLLELKELMVKKCNFADGDVVEIFKAMDAYHDNEIHYSEFLAAMLTTRINLHDQLLDTTFRNFDRDLSGYITADNLRDAFGDTFEGEKMETLLGEADVLKDGHISFDEFVAFVRGVPLGTQAVCLSYLPKTSSDAPVSLGGNSTTDCPKCCTVM